MLWKNIETISKHYPEKYIFFLKLFSELNQDIEIRSIKL
jgi:hypothetical protein